MDREMFTAVLPSGEINDDTIPGARSMEPSNGSSDRGKGSQKINSGMSVYVDSTGLSELTGIMFPAGIAVLFIEL